MRTIITTLAIATLCMATTFASAGTGTGKGSPTAGTTQTTQPANPCAQGETYDAAKNLCTRADGTTYTPSPR
jgi:hypothetical protein